MYPHFPIVDSLTLFYRLFCEIKWFVFVGKLVIPHFSDGTKMIFNSHWGTNTIDTFIAEAK